MVRIVLKQEGTQWVALCLDHDLAAQGPTMADALERLGIVMAHVKDLKKLPPVPTQYFEDARVLP